MINIFTREGIIEFLIILPVLLFSVAIHEFSHAFAAYKLGDRSQKAQGRLTIHPFAHIDWLGFISFALTGIGWGRPVFVDDRNFKKRSRDNAIVAFAGPFSNLVMAFVFTVILKILVMTNVLNVTSGGAASIIVSMIYTAILYNVFFAVFNMLPIPPFDGSKVLRYFLPNKLKHIVDYLEQYSLIIFLVLIVTGLHVYIVSPISTAILNLLSKILNM